MTATKDKADFDVIGTVQRILRSEKRTKLFIRAETGPRGTVIDVIMFRQNTYAKEGDRIEVTGNISVQKVGTEVSQRNGRTYDTWAPMLVGTEVKVLGNRQGDIPGTEPANDNQKPRSKPRDIPDDDIPF